MTSEKKGGKRNKEAEEESKERPSTHPVMLNAHDAFFFTFTPFSSYLSFLLSSFPNSVHTSQISSFFDTLSS